MIYVANLYNYIFLGPSLDLFETSCVFQGFASLNLAFLR